MQSAFKIYKIRKGIRQSLLFFMLMLVISGLTSIPVEWELSVVTRFFPVGSSIGNWLDEVYMAVHDTGSKYFFLFYGYDWLAFAHVMLALVFIGLYKDPVRNKWVVEFGIYACLLIIPFAFIAGAMRGIPFWWRLIHCSFGAIGLLPLIICYKKIYQLEELQTENDYQ